MGTICPRMRFQSAILPPKTLLQGRNFMHMIRRLPANSRRSSVYI